MMLSQTLLPGCLLMGICQAFKSQSKTSSCLVNRITECIEKLSISTAVQEKKKNIERVIFNLLIDLLSTKP